MVLHDISDDAIVVEVATTTIHTKGLFEHDLDIVDVLSVPDCAENQVGEASDEEVLDHFLSEIMVDSLDVRETRGVHR